MRLFRPDVSNIVQLGSHQISSHEVVVMIVDIEYIWIGLYQRLEAVCKIATIFAIYNREEEQKMFC